MSHFLGGLLDASAIRPIITMVGIQVKHVMSTIGEVTGFRAPQ